VAFGEITIALLAVPSGRGVIDSLLHRPSSKQTTVRPVPLPIFLATTHSYTVYTRYISPDFPPHQSSLPHRNIYINSIQKENIRNKTQTVTTVVENPKQIQKAIPKLTDRPVHHGRRTRENETVSK